MSVLPYKEVTKMIARGVATIHDDTRRLQFVRALVPELKAEMDTFDLARFCEECNVDINEIV